MQNYIFYLFHRFFLADFPALALPLPSTTVFRFLAFLAFQPGLNSTALGGPRMIREQLQHLSKDSTLGCNFPLSSVNNLKMFNVLKCLFGFVSPCYWVIAISIKTFKSFRRSEHFYHMHTYEKLLVFLFLQCCCLLPLSTFFIFLLIVLFL